MGFVLAFCIRSIHRNAMLYFKKVFCFLTKKIIESSSREIIIMIKRKLKHRIHVVLGVLGTVSSINGGKCR